MSQTACPPPSTTMPCHAMTPRGSIDRTTSNDRFRTPSACFEPSLNVVAVSGDRPDRLAPGEPSLWRVLRERVSPPGNAAISNVPSDSSSIGGGGGEEESLRRRARPVDLVLHAGGQSWIADAFEDAWELLKRRAMEPLLCADGGWQEAQEEATERLREVIGACLCLGPFSFQEERVTCQRLDAVVLPRVEISTRVRQKQLRVSIRSRKRFDSRGVSYVLHDPVSYHERGENVGCYVQPLCSRFDED